ncbi:MULTISPECIES: DUF882 domain-containing protein [unclassified Chelatococcus]|uniref:DUF882 domain-containing protein n=1 Tax=unclassified Chelatococcus TaxID=2638111 RepID=UPI0020BFEB71|nr:MULTISPECIES: DUF882 domain-containing protein [unclassified Chelatococcus]
MVAAGSALIAGTSGLQNAVANGDTRTISLVHAHSGESLTVTFRRNGSYDRDALRQLNHLLRDWRNQDTTTMDPKLFDILWSVHREVGSNSAIQVFSAYRSPDTNAMLRRRSSAVAKNSQHMEGKAIDFNLPDVSMAKVRAIGMRLQRGGVGYYPNTPFVHLDTGSVRSWPRMPRVQLAQLFPDGRTVHIPADGKPMAGYDLAVADIAARGDRVAGVAYADASASTGRRRSLWAALFGGDEEEDEEVVAPARTPRRTVVAARQPAPQPAAQQQVAYASSDNASTTSFFLQSANRPQSTAAAQRAQPAPAQQVPQSAPVQVAAAVPTPPRVTQPAMLQQPLELNALSNPRAAAPIIPAQLPVARPDDLTPPTSSQAVASLAPPPTPSFANIPLPPQRPSEANAAVQTAAQAAAPAVTASTLVALPLPPARPAMQAMADATPAAPQKPSEAQIALAAIAPITAAEASPAAAPMVMSFAPVSHPTPPTRPAAPQAVRTAQIENETSSQQTSTSQARQPAEPANPLQPLFRAEITHTRLANKPTVVVAQPRLVAVADRPVAQKPAQVVANSFAQKSGDDLSITRFSGPAVKPLDTVQFSTR